MTKEADKSKILLYKSKLRKEILTRLDSQCSLDISSKSLVIQKRLFELEEFKKARCVVAYVSMAGEVDTHRIIEESIRMGKTVGVPVLVGDSGGKGKRDLIISHIRDRIKELEVGPYGIKQPKAADIKPIPYEDMDMVLVPAVAFDNEGNRLGRGKGYYDRFLEKLPKHALKVGLCFDIQRLESVPILPHDIPVRVLLSNA